MKEIVYATPYEYKTLLQRYHTVTTMQTECSRSRSWGYAMAAACPSTVILRNIRTGKTERAVPRSYVQRYMSRVRRGNPNW